MNISKIKTKEDVDYALAHFVDLVEDKDVSVRSIILPDYALHEIKLNFSVDPQKIHVVVNNKAKDTKYYTFELEYLDRKFSDLLKNIFNEEDEVDFQIGLAEGMEDGEPRMYFDEGDVLTYLLKFDNKFYKVQTFYINPEDQAYRTDEEYEEFGDDESLILEFFKYKF